MTDQQAAAQQELVSRMAARVAASIDIPKTLSPSESREWLRGVLTGFGQRMLNEITPDMVDGFVMYQSEHD